MRAITSQQKTTGSSTGGHRSVSSNNALKHRGIWYETYNKEKQSS